MLSLTSSFITMIISFSIPRIIIYGHKHIEKENYCIDGTFYKERPNDPALSCYLLDNGLWKCLRNEEYRVDNDDSY